MATAGQMMPDLQHRMSKKIAQLTKVIYHLNNKNEDHDFDLQELSEQYESEIEQILRDAADKINTFKSQLEAKSADKNTAEAIKAIGRQHEEEKAKVMAEFNVFKQKVKEKEDMIQSSADSTITSLTREMQAMKDEFAARVAEFEQAMKAMEKIAMQAAGNKGASAKEQAKFEEEMKALRKEMDTKLADQNRENEKEVSDLVKKSNKKYNEMLAERMAMEDELRAEIERLKKQLADLEATGGENSKMQEKVLELQRLLAQKATEWENEQKAMGEEKENLNSAWRQKLEDLKDKLAAEEQKTLALSGLGLQLTDAQKAVEASQSEVDGWKQMLEGERAKSAKLEGSLKESEDNLRKTKQTLKMADDALKKAQAELERMRNDAADKAGITDSELDRIKRELVEEKTKGAASEKRVKELEGQVAQMKRDAGSADAGLKELQNEMDRKLAAAKEAQDKLNDEMKRIKAEKDKLSKEMDLLKKELDASHKLTDKWKSESEKLSADMARKVQELEKKVVDTKKAGDAELAEARKKIKALEAELSSLRDSMDSSNQAAADKMRKLLEKKMEEMRAKHKKESDDAQEDFKQQLNEQRKAAAVKLANREESLRMQMGEMKKNLDEAMQTSVQAYEKKLANKSEESQKQKNELKLQISELMQQLADQKRVITAMKEEKQKLENTMEERGRTAEQTKAKLEERLSAAASLEKNLQERIKKVQEAEAAARLEQSTAVKAMEGLRSEVENVKAAADKAAAAAKARLATEIEKVNQDWAKRAEERVKAAIAEAEVQFEVDKQAIRVEEKAAAQELKKQALADAAAAAQVREDKLRDEIKAAEQRKLDADAAHAKATIEAAEAAAADKEALRVKMDGEAQAAAEAAATREAEEKARHATELSTTIATHKNEMETTISSHKNEMDTTIAKHEAESTTARDTAEKLLQDTITEWSGRYDKDTNQLKTDHSNAMTALEAKLTSEHQQREKDEAARHDGVERHMQGQIDKLTDSEANLLGIKSNLEGHKSRLEGELAETQDTLEKTIVTARETEAQLKRDWEDCDAKLNAEHEAAMQATLDQHLQETKQLNEEFTANIEAMNQKLADQQEAYAELKERFDNRESRQEDLDRIAELEGGINARDAQIAENEGKQQVLKNELANREENYNKTFAGAGAAVLTVASGVPSWMPGGKKDDKGKRNSVAVMGGSSGRRGTQLGVGL